MLHILKVSKKIVLIQILVLCSGSVIYSQSILSNYRIKNYPTNEFHGASINHCLLQDNEGRIYAGNQFGLYLFDSQSWEYGIFTLNRSDVRSLGITNEGEILVGAQNEIGILRQQGSINYRYEAISQLLPDSLKDFDIAWQFTPFLNKTAIRTSKYVFIYSSNELTIVPDVLNPIYLGADKGLLYIINKEFGLTILDDSNVQRNIANPQLTDLDVVFMIKVNQENFIIGTANKGIYNLQVDGVLAKVNTHFSSRLEEYKISCGIKLHDGNFAIGTMTNGLFILDKEMRIINHITDKQGLKNKRVISVFQDKFNNIWCSLENNIAHIEYNSSFRYLNEAIGFNTPVYDHLIVDEKLIVASSNGLFQIDDLDNWNSNTQIMYFPTWKLQSIDDEVFISNHYGPFQYVNHDVKRLSGHNGIWNFYKIENKNILLAGTYQGILVYKRENGEWIFKNKLEGFEDGCKELLVDKHGVIWIAHGYKGVYRLVVDQDYTKVIDLDFYDQDKGFPSSLFLKMFVIDDAIFFGTQRGVYVYNEQKNRMEADEYFKSVLGDKEQIRLLKQDDEGNIWFIKGEDNFDATGIIKSNSPFSNIITEPFQKLRGLHNPGFENIYFKDNYVFFGAKSGSVIYLKDNVSRKFRFNTVLKKVKDSNDSVLVQPTYFINDTVKKSNNKLFNINSRSVEFEVVGVFFEDSKETQYSYYLENFSKEWSEWTSTNRIQFKDLKPGKYIFRAKSKNIYNVESEEIRFEFRIPLFTSQFRAILSLSIAVFIILLVIIFSKLIIRMKMLRLKLNRSDDDILSKSQKVLKRTRNEINKLQNEKSKAEEMLSMISFKLIAKDQQIQSLSETLRPLLPSASKENYNKLRMILKDLDDTEDSSNNNSDFELYFDKANANFISRLKEKYPDLNSNDVKICIYIKLNYSTKDIAHSLNITLKGVQAARLRIRKKLNLSNEVNLNDFLIFF